jgi:hypothetical protein
VIFWIVLPKEKHQLLLKKHRKAIATIISYEEWKGLKQLDIYLISEDDEESFSPEEVIKAYNQLHGTEFTVENIVNSRGGDSNFSSW